MGSLEEIEGYYAAILERHHLEFLDACRKVVYDALLARNLRVYEPVEDLAEVVVEALDAAGYLT